MGLENAPGSALGQINPASLTGQAGAVVEPRAVAALADAFRGGQISANDIHDRVSERAQAKEKMDIVLANRATAEAEDPALIEARRQQMLAAGAQGQLAGAQATAGLANVNEIEQLKLQMAQNTAQVAKYPMSAKFPELAAKYSVPTPRNPDGSLDFAKMSDLGAKLIAHDAKIENAKSVWNSISKETSADNTQLIRGVTHQGVRLTNEQFKAAEDATKESFFKVAPGAVAAPVSASVTPNLRSAGEGDITVEPRAVPAPASLPTVSTGDESAGTTLPSGNLSLGPPKPTAGNGGVKMTGEQAAQIAKGDFTVEMFKGLRNAQARLQKESPWLTGPVAGTVANWLFASKWDAPVADFEAAKTAIMAPMVKGIFQETGVLSNVDIARYNKVLPSIDQTPAVQKQNIDNLERHIYDSIIKNYESMTKQGIVPTQYAQQAQTFYTEARKRLDEMDAGGPTVTSAVSGSAAGAPVTPTPAVAPAAVKTVSTGRKFTRDGKGNMLLVP